MPTSRETGIHTHTRTHIHIHTYIYTYVYMALTITVHYRILNGVSVTRQCSIQSTGNAYNTNVLGAQCKTHNTHKGIISNNHFGKQILYCAYTYYIIIHTYLCSRLG